MAYQQQSRIINERHLYTHLQNLYSALIATKADLLEIKPFIDKLINTPPASTIYEATRSRISADYARDILKSLIVQFRVMNTYIANANKQYDTLTQNGNVAADACIRANICVLIEDIKRTRGEVLAGINEIPHEYDTMTRKVKAGFLPHLVFYQDN